MKWQLQLLLEQVWKNKTEKKEYLQSLIDSQDSSPREYDMKLSHEVGEFISHPKFGQGFVQGTIGHKKIEVYFELSEKVLLQNWDS